MRTHRRSGIFWISLLMIFYCAMTRADELPDDGQLWGSVTATGSFGVMNRDWRRLQFWLEGHGRFGQDMTTVSQGLLRPGLGYALSEKLSLWGGYAFIVTDQPFAAREFDEHRLWQQVLWTDTTPVGTVTLRSRFEQRFAVTGADAALRFRQLVKWSWPIPFAGGFSLVAANEVFVNVSNADWGPRQGLDQNRAFAGLGYAFDQHVKAEIGYMNQYIDRPIDPDRMSHILGINLLLNLPAD